MLRRRDPIGPENDRWLTEAPHAHAMLIACWGTAGSHRQRDLAMIATLPNLHCLGVTAGGHPAHPLYLRGDRRPIPFRIVD